MSQLVTGEAVTLHLRPARIGSRMLARLLDLGIETGLLLFLMQFLGVLAFADPQFVLALGIVVAVAFMVGYPVAFETLWRGRTPGKAALGLRVVRDDGGPIRFRHALTRGLLNIVDLWLTSASVGVITSMLSKRGKRVGDMVAGTFVVQERVPRQFVAPVHMPPPLAAWGATLDLSRLPDDLALAVRGFLGRAGELRPEARDRLGAELAAAVASCVSPPPPDGTPGWAYLAAVVAERRRREEARMPGRSGHAAFQPSPWQAAAPSPGWGTAPDRPPWSASAPPTGAPPPFGSSPPVGHPPRDPGPPYLPPGPSPQWGPAPVAPSPPPPSGAPPGSPSGPPSGAPPGSPSGAPPGSSSGPPSPPARSGAPPGPPSPSGPPPGSPSPPPPPLPVRRAGSRRRSGAGSGAEPGATEPGGTAGDAAAARAAPGGPASDGPAPPPPSVRPRTRRAPASPPPPDDGFALPG